MAVSERWKRITAPFMSAEPARPLQEDIPVNSDDLTSCLVRLMGDSDAEYAILAVFDAELEDLEESMSQCSDNIPLAKFTGAYLSIKRLRGIFASHRPQD